jgi:hypothetical protein
VQGYKLHSNKKFRPNQPFFMLLSFRKIQGVFKSELN